MGIKKKKKKKPLKKLSILMHSKEVDNWLPSIFDTLIKLINILSL